MQPCVCVCVCESVCGPTMGGCLSRGDPTGLTGLENPVTNLRSTATEKWNICVGVHILEHATLSVMVLDGGGRGGGGQGGRRVEEGET